MSRSVDAPASSLGSATSLRSFVRFTFRAVAAFWTSASWQRFRPPMTLDSELLSAQGEGLNSYLCHAPLRLVGVSGVITSTGCSLSRTNHIYIPGLSFPEDQSHYTHSDHGTNHCAFSLSSSRFAARSFICSCFNAAFTFLCRFLLPFPRLGPSMTTDSAMRCFRFASCSARCFSRFLSRLRSVVKDALRRVP